MREKNMKMIGKGEMTLECNGELIGTTCIDIVCDGKDAILDVNLGDTTPKYKTVALEDGNVIYLIPFDIKVHDINHKETDIIIEGREVHYLE
jgi:hypothetical protein